MQLPWSRQFTVPPNGRVESAEVGEGGGKGESVQHLRDASPSLVSFPLVSPIAGGQRILQAVCDGPGLDGQLQVEVLQGTVT